MNFSILEHYLNSLEQSFGVRERVCFVYQNHECIYQYSSLDRPSYFGAEQRGLWFVYSATKPLSCAAVMQLVESGRIGLDDPVSKYLDCFSNLKVSTPDGLVPANKALTIRHLLTMTGGYDYDLNAACIKQVVSENALATTKEIIKALSGKPLLFHPGEHFQYSLCHDILAGVIESAAGISFEDYIKKNICKPLGLRDMYFTPHEDIAPRIMPQYRYTKQPNEIKEIERKNEFIFTPRYESAGAGLLCSAEDYILFADAMACGGQGKNGQRILSESSISQMKENAMTAATQKDFDEQGWQGLSLIHI